MNGSLIETDSEGLTLLKEEEKNDLFEKFFLFLFLKKRYIYQ